MLPLISINHGYKKRFRNENSGDCTVERHSNGGAFSGSTSSGSYANGCGCGCGCYSYDNAYFSAPNFSVSMYSCSYDYGSGPTSYESVNVNYPGTASYGFGSFVYGMPTSHIPNGNVPANAKPPENRKVGTAEIIVAQPNFDNYHWVDMDFWLDAQNPVLGNTGPDNPEFVYTELVGFACFRAGTLVYNDFDSCTKIEEIKVGDFVLAVPDNDPSAPPRRCRITKVLHNPPACTWKISLQRDGFSIQEYDVTGEHPFYTRNRGWTDVASLEIGDICIDKDGKEVRFFSKAFDPEPVPVFNLEVENCHTYFVGDKNGNSVLVHNQYGPLSINPTPPPSKNEAQNVQQRIFNNTATGITMRSIRAGTPDNPFPKIGSDEKVSALVAAVALELLNGADQYHIQLAIKNIDKSVHNTGNQNAISTLDIGNRNIISEAAALKDNIESLYFTSKGLQNVPEFHGKSVTELRDIYVDTIYSGIQDKIRSDIRNHILLTEIRGENRPGHLSQRDIEMFNRRTLENRGRWPQQQPIPPRSQRVWPR